ncbi:hypothetical protein AVEN_4340-1 [Araneus ventricosus]|uniref:Uncharacterized protein n=1 Tax=Araneus ventricosus TaxID=182803 RepID=A0A4Y2TWH9_ARAVE|nr:hypothetical protein AVEN_4340-1 [Araneus ventricosus]
MRTRAIHSSIARSITQELLNYAEFRVKVKRLYLRGRDNCLAHSFPNVTNTCRLLWLLAIDCHDCVTPTLVQLGLTRKSAPALSSHACWERSATHVFCTAVLKGLIPPPLSVYLHVAS